MNLQLFFSRSSFRFSLEPWQNGVGKGRILDEIPLEIRENHVQKVCFCGERPLDLNFIDFGGPGSSVGELFGPSEEGDGSKARRVGGWGRVGGPPGRTYRSKILVSFNL